MSELLYKFESLPEFLSANDLVDLGLFPSPDAAYFARVRGEGPEFIKFGRKIRYMKMSVKKFIESRLQEKAIPKKHQTPFIKEPLV